MNYLVNFATANFYRSQERLNRSALLFGIDKVISYREEDLIGTEFYKKNIDILQQPRGGGYWIWKPYILLDVLSKVRGDDIVIYCDSGIEIIRSLEPLFKICADQDGLMIFRTHIHRNKNWTKRDCFVLMDCDSEKYWEAEQVNGGFSLHMNTKKNMDFLEEWLYYCCKANVVTDIPNICGLENLPEFKDHRHDQSILSLLAVKHNIAIYRDPSQFGNSFKMEEFRHHGEELFYFSNDNINDLQSIYALQPYSNSPYDTLLNIHRQKDW